MAKTKKIEVIEGKTNPNIILVAPHGVKGDDDNAGKLARAIQKRLGCHAIINESFKRPEDKEDGSVGELNAKKGLYDLNYKPHAEAHPNYIKNITSKITDPANTFVFWIHGVDDDHLVDDDAKKYKYENAKCLVGYGQGKGNGKSIDEKKAKALIDFLNENGIATAAPQASAPNFRGAAANRMNQYFKVTGGGHAGVQSVQLEFAKEGVRVRKHITAAGIKVAKAVAKLVGCDTVNIREEEANEDLVKEATEKVMGFINANHKNNVAVGHYLIEKFYDNNYEKAKKGNASKGKSLNAMLDGLQKAGNAPSKSWFYNAVNLAVDDKEFENNEDYKKLNLSHKIHLTYLNKKEEYQTHKKALIAEIAKKEGMEIKTLRERISFIKGKSEPATLPSVDDLVKMKEDEIVKHKEKAEKRKQAIQDAINKLNQKIAEQQAELEKCDEFLNAVHGSTMKQAA